MNTRNWTSFNSGKLFSHVGRWSKIARGNPIPPPLLVTVDPSNACNLSCNWCNAAKVSQSNAFLSKDALRSAAKLLSEWISEDGKYKVDAVCIAGGGEPLLNPHVGDFMLDLYSRKIDVASVTNGLLIDKFIDALLWNRYVAVSVDAGNSKTFVKYKHPNNGEAAFNTVIENIEALCKKARSVPCALGDKSPSAGVNYRMLLYKDNIGEIVEAATIAQEIGCKNLHVRPAGVPYDCINSSFRFSKEDIELFYEQVRLVNEIKRDDFGFHYSIEKFDDMFQKSNDFSMCYAVFMTATLMPPRVDAKDSNAFCLNLCCDRRSDDSMLLIRNGTDFSAISRLWGSEIHWRIFDGITKDQITNTCPRCTYYEHNKIFENCILSDNMLLSFI